MPRSDLVGMFWDDTPPPAPPKAEKIVRTPPEPVWLRPDYLPGLAEARAFPVRVMTVEELVQAAGREELIVDVECFPNYFLACFTSVQTGAVFGVEMVEEGPPLNTSLLGWILSNFLTIGFNSKSYDVPICQLAVAGLNNRQLKAATNRIIQDDQRSYDVMRAFKVKPFDLDHIDLIEVAPLRGSLKAYAGRLHVRKMQDLPFHPDTELTPDQITIVRWYCVNDITNTAALRECLRKHIELRYQLSGEYGVDLRSRSDAQVAEAVISAELTRLLGKKPEKPTIPIGTIYQYRVPEFIRYESALMNWALDVVRSAMFVVDHNGRIAMPEVIDALNLDINGSVYRMGIGGLHSSEQTIAHHSDEQYVLIDKDVTSYYPYIILNCGLAPRHLGKYFLDVYRSIVERRVAAKALDKKGPVAESLKIVVNGSFGKLGSKWSILYSPDLMIQVTITGQLSLLMLIERLELAGIHVVSANTDGIVIKCPREARTRLDAIVRGWEEDTGFETEESVYAALYSRDVNNYIAVTEDGKTKNKGAYSNPWSTDRNLAERLRKNPTATICVEAVEAYLTKRVPLFVTINACREIAKFVSVRTVKGGAVKVWEDGRVEYLGKVVRWYYGTGTGGELVYAGSGNKVPRSDGAMPLMELPTEFPPDVDLEWYEAEATRILQDIGALPRRTKGAQAEVEE
jgi:hypothetical protein